MQKKKSKRKHNSRLFKSTAGTLQKSCFHSACKYKSGSDPLPKIREHADPFYIAVGYSAFFNQYFYCFC